VFFAGGLFWPYLVKCCAYLAWVNVPLPIQSSIFSSCRQCPFDRLLTPPSGTLCQLYPPRPMFVDDFRSPLFRRFPFGKYTDDSDLRIFLVRLSPIRVFLLFSPFLLLTASFFSTSSPPPSPHDGRVSSADRVCVRPFPPHPPPPYSQMVKNVVFFSSPTDGRTLA